MQPAYQQFFVITLQEIETLIENHFAHIRKIQIAIHYDIISGYLEYLYHGQLKIITKNVTNIGPWNVKQHTMQCMTAFAFSKVL